MDGKADVNQMLFEPLLERWRRPLCHRAPPGSRISLTT